MELRQIKYFLGVAKHLSFSKAAIELNIVQPALSRQIKQLEDELGFVLLERTKRNVQLSTAGLYFQNEMVQVINSIDITINQAKNIQVGSRGVLRIGYPGSAIYTILPASLVLFKQKFENVETILNEMTEKDLIENIVNHKTDIGFLRVLSNEKKIIEVELFSEPLALVVPTHHTITLQNFKNILDCKNEPFILPHFTEQNFYGQIVLNLFRKMGIMPKIAYESNNGATILSFVEKGLGISIMPLSYRLGSSHNLRFIPLQERSSLYMAYRKDDQNPTLKNFIATTNEALIDVKQEFEKNNLDSSF
jgi:LysR family transcriptional regulator, benzoate and cis,cis-muconate-responsive activator of ben and cat genes